MLSADKDYTAAKIRETKSRRFNGLMRPLLWKRLTREAEASNTSANELMNRAVEQYLRGRAQNKELSTQTLAEALS